VVRAVTTMTIQEYLARVWEMLIGRLQGPLTFRLILQPLAAVIIAIRVGIRDAREGRTPYFWTVLIDPVRRPELIRLAWKDVRKVFVFAFVLDAVYQVIVHHWVYLGQAFIVATVLAIIPYLLIRGPVTRIMRRVFALKGGKSEKVAEQAGNP
jgi:hypothetical protein